MSTDGKLVAYENERKMFVLTYRSKSCCSFSGCSLIRLGYKRALENNDLWALNPQDRCNSLGPKFEHYWQQELNSGL